MNDPKSILSDLLDWSFRRFVTPQLIKVLYVIGIALAALWSLGILFSFAAQGVLMFFAGIIVAPLVFILGVLYARVVLELVMVIFRISETNGAILQKMGGEAPAPAEAPAPPPAPKPTPPPATPAPEAAESEPKPEGSGEAPKPEDKGGSGVH